MPQAQTSREERVAEVVELPSLRPMGLAGKVSNESVGRGGPG